VRVEYLWKIGIMQIDGLVGNSTRDGNGIGFVKEKKCPPQNTEKTQDTRLQKNTRGITGRRNRMGENGKEKANDSLP